MKSILDNGELQIMVSRLDHISENKPALWGVMTAHQMIVHVSDPIRDILGERPARVVVSPLLRPFIKWYILRRRGFRKNLVTFRPYLQAEKGKGSALTSFSRDTSELIRLIGTFCHTKEDFAFGPHAGAGLLTRTQYGLLLWKHLDHHFRQFGA